MGAKTTSPGTKRVGEFLRRVERNSLTTWFLVIKVQKTLYPQPWTTRRPEMIPMVGIASTITAKCRRIWRSLAHHWPYIFDAKKGIMVSVCEQSFLFWERTRSFVGICSSYSWCQMEREPQQVLHSPFGSYEECKFFRGAKHLWKMSRWWAEEFFIGSKSESLVHEAIARVPSLRRCMKRTLLGLVKSSHTEKGLFPAGA